MGGQGLLEPVGPLHFRRSPADGAGRHVVAFGPATSLRRDGTRPPRPGSVGGAGRMNGLTPIGRMTLAAIAWAALCGAAADPAERMADPAKEARARAIFHDV